MFLATESDKIHLAGLLRDNLISAGKLSITKRLKNISTPEKFKGVSIDQINEWLSLEKNDARWLILPTEKGVKFIDDYFGGKEID